MSSHAVTQEAFDQAVNELKSVNGHEFLMQLGARFPDLGHDEFLQLAADSAERLAARIARNGADLETLQLVRVTIFDDSMPGSITVEEAARRKAGSGDPGAAQVLAYLESPAYRTSCAILDAAVDVHPEWSRTENGDYRYTGTSFGTEEDQDASGRLIDWFIDAHPAEAAAIAERVTGKPAASFPAA